MGRGHRQEEELVMPAKTGTQSLVTAWWRARRMPMLKPWPLAAAVGALLLPNPAGAIENCKATTTCASALQTCVAYRTKNKLSASDLNCEEAKTACNSTGVWRSKYVRNNPAVTECKVVKR